MTPTPFINVFRVIAGVLALAFILIAIGHAEEIRLEPLPTDPKQRIYYGEYYDPQRYEACRKKLLAEGKPGSTFCDIFAERLEPLDPSKRDHYGEFYDPRKHHECRAKVEKNDAQCDYLKLKRRPEPEYWPYAGKVPPPKWPEAPKQSVYRKGMTSKEYFDARCKAEAGEFIYKTVENVEGIYQIRPRLKASTETLHDRYVMEDPYGYTDREAQKVEGIFVHPGFRYDFLEVPIAAVKIEERAKATFVRTSRVPIGGRRNRNDDGIKKQEAGTLQAQYGYTWRGIRRPYDRENNIAGGELIVVDLRTNNVLGMRRGFIHVQVPSTKDYSVDWDHWYVCPRFTDQRGVGKAPDFVYWFVGKILKPAKLGSTFEESPNASR